MDVLYALLMSVSVAVVGSLRTSYGEIAGSPRSSKKGGILLDELYGRREDNIVASCERT